MIDFHTHPVLIREFVQKYPTYEASTRRIFDIGNNFQPLETFLLHMDVAGIDKSVLLPMDCARARGLAVSSNDQVAELCAMRPERFIGFASVDPLKKGAVPELEHAVKAVGLKGLKLDPSLQQFDPCGKEAFTVYEAAQALGIPVVIHTGMSWAPGTAISGGQPLVLEGAIQKFTKLPFVLSHFAWPWVWEGIALAMKYPNAYLDTSCLYYDSPKEFFQFLFSKQVPTTVIERSLRNKVIFGSNYPRVEIKNMVHALKSLALTERCQELILRANAERLLKVGKELAAATAHAGK